MKFISVRELRLKPGDVWKAVQKEHDLIVTSNGKPVAMLIAVKEDTLEDEIDTIRTARALKALDNIQRKSIERKTDRISLKDINNEINGARKVRKR